MENKGEIIIYERLKDYLIKGYALNEKRLKQRDLSDLIPYPSSICIYS